MKKIIYVLLLPVILMSCLAFAKLKNNQPENKISAIDGIEKLGKNPLVLINGKVYPKSILYQISSACITSTGIWDPSSTIIKNGVIIKDGFVELTTKNGKITYLTQPEKENLIKEKNIPKDRFYTRLRLHDLKKGGFYDKVIVQTPSGSTYTSDLPINGKAGFLIDDKVYNEKQAKEISPEVINSLKPEGGVGPAESKYFPGINVNGYDIIFHFNSRNTVANTKYQQKLKRTPRQLKSKKELEETSNDTIGKNEQTFKITKVSYRVPESVLEPLKRYQKKSEIVVDKSVTVNTFKKEQARVYNFLAAMLPNIQQKDIVFNVDTTLQKGTCTVMTVVHWKKPDD